MALGGHYSLNQKAYEDFVKDTNASIEAKSKDIVNKSETRAKAETDLVEAKEDKESVMLELEQLANSKAELHSSCDFVIIVAGGQFLNSWNWGRQAPGSGIYRLGEDELDRREFAAVGNPLARPKSARCRAIEANLGRIRPRRIRGGRESASAQGGSEGRAWWLPAWVRSTPAN